MNADALMTLLAGRRSYRRFDESRPVPDDALADMLEAARLSSCAGNRQLLRFVIVRSPRLCARVFPLTRWGAALPEGRGTPPEGRRPVLYCAVTVPEDRTSSLTDTDAGLAMGSMTLAAWAHGIGSCILGSIDRPALAQALELPPDRRIQSLIAFGYPAHTSEVVPPWEDGSLRYRMTEDDDLLVPKLPVSELTVIL